MAAALVKTTVSRQLVPFTSGTSSILSSRATVALTTLVTVNSSITRRAPIKQVNKQRSREYKTQIHTYIAHLFIMGVCYISGTNSKDFVKLTRLTTKLADSIAPWLALLLTLKWSIVAPTFRETSGTSRPITRIIKLSLLNLSADRNLAQKCINRTPTTPELKALRFNTNAPENRAPQ